MGDVRLTNDIFQTAFGGINETYLAVSDRNGRRVRRATSEMRVPAADYPRLSTTGLRNSDEHGAPYVNQVASSPCKSDTAQGKDWSPNGSDPQGRPSTSRRVNLLDAEGRVDADATGGRPIWETRKATHPATINTFAANVSAGTVSARSNVNVGSRARQQVGGGAYTTTTPTTQHSENGPEMEWPLLLQDTQVPDSASIIGGLGFDEELSQATRRVKQLQVNTDRDQLLQLNRSHRVHREMLDGAESLIDFGTKSAIPVVGRPASGQVCGPHLKKADSLIDYESDEA